MGEVLQLLAQGLGLTLFFLAHAAALVMIPLGLPGTFLQVGAALILTAATGGGLMGWPWVGLFLAMAVIGEVMEFLSGQWGARRFGGSRAAAWGALIGGLVGAAAGGIAVPLIGSIVTSFAGTFVGALAGEMYQQRQAAPDLRVGTGALVGRIAGVAAKLFLAVLMVILSAAVLAAQLLGGGT